MFIEGEAPAASQSEGTEPATAAEEVATAAEGEPNEGAAAPAEGAVPTEAATGESPPEEAAPASEAAGGEASVPRSDLVPGTVPAPEEVTGLETVPEVRQLLLCTIK